MPGPDPEGLDLEELENGGFRIYAEVWEHGNKRHRIARMLAVSRNMRAGGWRCWGCGEQVPLYKRADARFCSEPCRKNAGRRRRQWRI